MTLFDYLTLFVLVISLIGSAVAGVLVYKLVEKPMLAKGHARVKRWTLQMQHQRSSKNLFLKLKLIH